MFNSSRRWANAAAVATVLGAVIALLTYWGDRPPPPPEIRVSVHTRWRETPDPRTEWLDIVLENNGADISIVDIHLMGKRTVRNKNISAGYRIAHFDLSEQMLASLGDRRNLKSNSLLPLTISGEMAQSPSIKSLAKPQLSLTIRVQNDIYLFASFIPSYGEVMLDKAIPLTVGNIDDWRKRPKIQEKEWELESERIKALPQRKNP